MRVVSCSLKEEMKEGGKEGKKEGRKGRRTFIPLQRHGGAIPAIQKFATAACSTLHTSTQIICFKLLHVCVCVLLFLSLCTQGNWRCVYCYFYPCAHRATGDVCTRNLKIKKLCSTLLQGAFYYSHLSCSDECSQFRRTYIISI